MIRLTLGSLPGWALGLALFPQIGLWAILVGFVLAGVGGLVVAAATIR